jgi:hypothetical protein
MFQFLEASIIASVPRGPSVSSVFAPSLKEKT